MSLVVVAAAAAYYFTSAEHNTQRVTVKCMYTAYACGDCYPQYNVREVIPYSLEKKDP